MEERPFQLNDCVVVHDEHGKIGMGVIVGRSFDQPMKYDVKVVLGNYVSVRRVKTNVIEQNVHLSVPAETLRHVQ